MLKVTMNVIQCTTLDNVDKYIHSHRISDALGRTNKSTRLHQLLSHTCIQVHLCL